MMNDQSPINDPIVLARRFMQTPKALLIGGKWMPAKSGKMIESIDPATEEVIAHIAAGDAADVDAAVAAARLAFETGDWPAATPAKRGALLWRLADLIERNSAELAAIETFDNGAPLAMTNYMMATAAEFLRFFAGQATKLYGQTVEISSPIGEFHAYTRGEPVGVAGLITPWNGPLGTVCIKVGPAIAAGCTCVLKPAELTSLTAIRFGELVIEAGFPPGVINIVTGHGAEAGSAIATHSGIDKISFTGSTAVARTLIDAAKGNFKRLTLELGGKSPLIIDDEAELESAIPGAAMAIFANSGQVCFAGSRLFIHSKIYDNVVAGLADVSKEFTLGNGFDPATRLGPVISRKQQDRVMSYIESGRAAGAEIVTGGQTHSNLGYFVQPTIFANVDRNATIAREEIFGPVLVANRYDDLDEVIKIANDTPYGLGSGVFTRDLSKAHRIAKRLRAGNVWINCYGVMDPSMPFGGFKESGWGRELGSAGVDAFREFKSVFARL
jgi:phenylacetaldehyde dehydrogenase